MCVEMMHRAVCQAARQQPLQAAAACMGDICSTRAMMIIVPHSRDRVSQGNFNESTKKGAECLSC